MEQRLESCDGEALTLGGEAHIGHRVLHLPDLHVLYAIPDGQETRLACGSCVFLSLAYGSEREARRFVPHCEIEMAEVESRERRRRLAERSR